MARLGWAVLGAAVSLAAMGQPNYSVEWDRGFGEARYACNIESAALDGGDGLWVVCDGYDYAESKLTTNLYGIDRGTAELKFATELNLPRSGPKHAFYPLRLVRGAGAMFALAGMSTGGRDITFEGVFLTALGSSGSAGATVQVVPEGSQLQDVVPTKDGNLLIAADQSPMSIRMVTPSGKAMWTRVFGPEIDLPDMAMFPDDSICVSAQPYKVDDRRPALQLIRLDPVGRVSQRISIAAAQGAVAAGPGQTCALMYSDSFGQNSLVRIAGYDARLQRVWDAPTPFTGRFGRDYTLDLVSDGYLATGETTGREEDKRLAKLSRTGAVEWTTPLPRGFQKAVVSRDGVFLVLRGDGASFHVQKIRIN